MYTTLLLIHIIAAVVGIGATFATPALMGNVKTVEQARFALNVSLRIEKIAKPGSITLLVTGLLLGALQTGLFTEFWYIASIVIYIAVQPIAAGILPKKAKEMLKTLENPKKGVLPEPYYAVAKSCNTFHNVLYAAAIILILLMTVKPF